MEQAFKVSFDVEDNRGVFLRAGAELLQEAAAGVALRGLTVRAVTKRAKRSTGAFYHYWETQRDYTMELVRTLLSPASNLEHDPIIHGIADLATRDVADARDMLDLFEFACADQTHDPVYQLQMLLWAVGDDNVHDALRQMYAEYQVRTVRHYRDTLERIGLDLVPGVTYDALAAMLAIVLDGLSIRRRFDPANADSQVSRSMLAAVLGACVAPCGTTKQGPIPTFEALVGEALGAQSPPGID